MNTVKQCTIIKRTINIGLINDISSRLRTCIFYSYDTTKYFLIFSPNHLIYNANKLYAIMPFFTYTYCSIPIVSFGNG